GAKLMRAVRAHVEGEAARRDFRAGNPQKRTIGGASHIGRTRRTGRRTQEPGVRTITGPALSEGVRSSTGTSSSGFADSIRVTLETPLRVGARTEVEPVGLGDFGGQRGISSAVS